MIYSTSGSSAGIGFAIPVDTVRRVVNQLVRYGKVKRPGLGLYLASDMQAKSLGVQGALVMSVTQGSGAAAAGLRGTYRDSLGRIVRGDVVVAVGGDKVEGVEDLLAAIERFDAGDLVTLTLMRDGRTENVQVRLQEMVDM